MFKTFEYKIDLVAVPFDNLKYRDRTVLIMCKDKEGNFLLGSKGNHYPEGIVRLMGGGVDAGETVSEAAIREIREEMGITVLPNELLELAEVKVQGNYKDITFKTSVFICFLNSDKDDFLAGDDVSEILKYSEEEYRQLIANFLGLRDEIVMRDDIPTFSWGDYGKVYGFIHQVALDEALSKGL